ncbi:MAG: WbuC family cupin fold metalloprotein [Acidobacteria bacterium]|nr:WbuC family cupin fold metalloprotein [Acidobacteriota bacterium]
MQSVQTFDTTLLDDLLARAHQVPRLRAIHCFHDGDWEHCHRMLNALAVGTYVCPHRHGDQHQTEAFLLLRGKLAILVFDDAGNFDLSRSHVLSLSNGDIGLQIKPGIYHTLIALEDSVIYEVKGHPTGGFVMERDKDFAPWAPAEGSEAAKSYLHKLESLASQIPTARS